MSVAWPTQVRGNACASCGIRQPLHWWQRTLVGARLESWSRRERAGRLPRVYWRCHPRSPTNKPGAALSLLGDCASHRANPLGRRALPRQRARTSNSVTVSGASAAAQPRLKRQPLVGGCHGDQQACGRCVLGLEAFGLLLGALPHVASREERDAAVEKTLYKRGRRRHVAGRPRSRA